MHLLIQAFVDAKSITRIYGHMHNERESLLNLLNVNDREEVSNVTFNTKYVMKTVTEKINFLDNDE